METYEAAAKEGTGARQQKFGTEITLLSCGAAGLVCACEGLILVNGSNDKMLLHFPVLCWNWVLAGRLSLPQ